ncbi:MAG: uracil-DNA glycosylase [Bacteroidales bacterium]
MEEFELLKKEVLTCQKCELCKTRHNVVFGEGNRHAHIMCIGEGPGYYEDMQGKPFVGKSGVLLNRIFEVCGFTREEHIFIANIVKCRPPGNRDPKPEERQACIPYLYRQIELINPEIIILLGATALKGLIDPNARISQIRGQWLDWNGRLVMPTYHPSALLRNPNLKRAAWDDFKAVIDKYREIINPQHHSDYH